jgi:hypothetical protein
MIKENGVSGTSLNSRENSNLSKNAPFQARKGRRPSFFAGGRSIRVMVALVAAGLFVFSQSAQLRAQSEMGSVPVTRKPSPGRKQQAYSGRIQSLDLKEKILSVTALHGQDSEIFPIKKNVRVENLVGGRLRLDALTPGMSVLIYYDQKSGERTVKHIVVLSSGKSPAKGKSAPSS